MKKLTLKELSCMCLKDMYKHQIWAKQQGDKEYDDLVSKGYSNILHFSIWGKYKTLPYPFK